MTLDLSIQKPLLQVVNLRKYFPIREGFFSRASEYVQAVDDVSFSIPPGKTLGLVGESGCGKSTIGRTVLKLMDPTSGKIFLKGRDITDLTKSQMRPLRTEMQLIFQDPFSSLNPRMTAGAIVKEPLSLHKLSSGNQSQERVLEVFERVGLRADQMGDFPHQFSGGQRQRIGIARALILDPTLVVGDEPVSALDVSIQAQIINLLMSLQDDLGIAYLFISHDLAVVKHISHQVAVMYLGKIVEVGNKTAIFDTPQHPYTKALLSAVPSPRPTGEKRKRMLLSGDVPSPINPPVGCRFHERCPYVMDRCKSEPPRLKEIAPEHWLACHLED
tara:strand:- start:969 stop:1958 length:990 start_codon:yes stop_codon:yes gene_type:complete